MLHRVQAVSEVFGALQSAKAGASAFYTNFFPVEAKVQSWIAHEELWFERGERTTFFLRKDRDFWRLYICATDSAALQQELPKLSVLQTEPLIMDVVGNLQALGGWEPIVKGAGLHPYSRLQRMARIPQAGASIGPAEQRVEWAASEDLDSIIALLRNSFDHYADHLPPDYEVAAAIEAHQIIKVTCEGRLAAILFFETVGVTSTLRYWAVVAEFQSRRLGAAVIRHYFDIHRDVRRFLLWVVLANENALSKYGHYGYAADGLFDFVFVNDRIRL